MAQAAAATTSSNNNSGSSSSENAIVPFVLLAEFDIDEGSLLRHSYPSPTGTDTHLLAELMLPDGAHSRNEDWTIFFLNQGTVKPGTQQDNPTPNTLVVEDGGTAEKQPLLHVLNLVRTKKDDRVRRCACVIRKEVVLDKAVKLIPWLYASLLFCRGALVKALAVCTPKPYIQIFKVSASLILLYGRKPRSSPWPASAASRSRRILCQSLRRRARQTLRISQCFRPLPLPDPQPSRTHHPTLL